MPTKLWAVRSALVSMFDAALSDPVYDGPSRQKTPPKRFVLVGSDGGETGMGDGDEDGAVIEQSPSSMGNGWRDERGEITCAAWAWSGDTDLAPLRTAITAMVDVAEAALAGDRSLGGLLVPPGMAEFSGLRIREAQTSKGAVVRALFTVSYGALLTS